MAKDKIREALPERATSNIPKQQNVTNHLNSIYVSFSFKHLDVKHKKFKIVDKQAKYFIKMLERLKSLSTLTVKNIRDNHSIALRAHPIDWEKTTEKKGFDNLNEQLCQLEPYQFSVSQKAHGRVHGFFIENVFFIVWFDPDHKLYSSK